MPLPAVPENLIRSKLAAGKTVVGAMVIEFRQPSLMGILAEAGLDFALLDNEHGPFSIESIADLSRAGRAAGITPIVRIPELTYANVTQALDAGAQGIMLPRVTDPDQIRFCLECMKYTPDGRRGVVLGRGHTGFRVGPVREILDAMNRETFLIVQIETREALEKIDELLAVPGLDAALVGPTDLSVALGVPGRMDDPVLVTAIETVLRTCQARKVVPAIHTNDVAMTAHWARQGMRLVSISSEVGLLMSGVREAAQRVRG